MEIEAIETIPVRVELPRLYSGSHYRMPNRCTVITTIRTSDGIIGEAYNADTDEDQFEIIRIINEELA
ncbi:MAG: mandelate racemase/muconate lactonizing enzyme family protein, partial [Acidimicrobiia bacterium]